MSERDYTGEAIDALRADIETAVRVHLDRTPGQCSISINDHGTEVARSIDGTVLIERITELTVSVELESTTTTSKGN